MEIEKFKSEFYSELLNLHKEASVNFVLEKLHNNDITVKTLYTEVLTPFLNNLKVEIWEEHIISGIIRTIIECCYPFVLNSFPSKKTSKKVLILCPPEEYHELGARMGSDFFTMAGYDSYFIGSNTPKEDFVTLINKMNPYYIVISVTNYYNLFSTKEIIQHIKQLKLPVKIIAAGGAFINYEDSCEDIGVDMILHNFEDINKFTAEVIK